MRKFIVIAVLLACSTGAQAHILDRIDNWFLMSEMGQTLISIVKSTGLPVREKFR